MPPVGESLAKSIQNEKLTMEAFQVLERLRLLALHKGFSGVVGVELIVKDGVIQ